MADVRMSLHDGTLADLLDRLVASGAVIDGNVIITLADVDLIRLDLHAMLAAVETVRPHLPPSGATALDEPPPAREPARTTQPASDTIPAPHADRSPPPDPRAAVARPEPAGPPAGRGDTADSQPALAGLVVAIVDIVRQLLERQALRRMAAGSLTGDQVEHLGRALMSLEQQVTELTEILTPRQRSHRKPPRQPPGNPHAPAAEGSQ